MDNLYEIYSAYRDLIIARADQNNFSFTGWRHNVNTEVMGATIRIGKEYFPEIFPLLTLRKINITREVCATTEVPLNTESAVEGELDIHLKQVFANNPTDVMNRLLAENKGLVDISPPAIQAIFYSALSKNIKNMDIIKDLEKYKVCVLQQDNNFILISNYPLTTMYHLNNLDYALGNVRELIDGRDFNLHILLSLVPAFYEPLRAKLTPQEFKLFKLFSKGPDMYGKEFTDLLRDLLSTPEIMAPIEAQNKLFFTEKIEKTALAIYENKIARQKDAIQQQEADLETQYRDLLNYQKELLLQQYQKDGQKSDTADYILNHSYLKKLIVNKNSNTIGFLFRVPLTNWDPEPLSLVLANSGKPDEHLCYIIQKLLIENKGVIHFLAYFNINLESYGWDTVCLRGSNLYESYMETYKAHTNPHIENYRCFGDNRTAITTTKNNKDLVGMVEAILGGYKNINFVDGAVVRNWFQTDLPRLYKSKIACIDYEGETYTLRDYEMLMHELEKPIEEVKLPEKKKRVTKKMQEQIDNAELGVEL